MLCIKRPHVIGKIKLTFGFSLAKYIIHFKSCLVFLVPLLYSSFPISLGLYSHHVTSLSYPHHFFSILFLSPSTPFPSSTSYLFTIPSFLALTLPTSCPSPYTTFIITDKQTKEWPLFSLRKRRIIENQD